MDDLVDRVCAVACRCACGGGLVPATRELLGMPEVTRLTIERAITRCHRHAGASWQRAGYILQGALDSRLFEERQTARSGERASHHRGA